MKSTTPAVKSAKLTVTLSDVAPVTIVRDDWPVIAAAKDWEARYEGTGFPTWRLTVRQHHDGRTLVYGVYTNRDDDRDRRAGVLLTPSKEEYPAKLVKSEKYWNGARVSAAIKQVAASCGCEVIADRCIADLPPDELK